MTGEQKAAIARIISDVIKADNIIEESEIERMKELMDEYSIGSREMTEARRIKFSEAVSVLQDYAVEGGTNKTSRIKHFFEEIYSIAMSDNQCVPREVLLMSALKYCLLDPKGETDDSPYLLSCPTGEASTNEQYIVYLESSFNEKLNNEIQQNFRLLVSLSRLCGFHFIYIPKMVQEFNNMRKEYVIDVIRYMAPSLSDRTIIDIYDRLCGMNTKAFYKNVLQERMQIKSDDNIKPSLLVNIGTSVVPYCAADGSVQYYTEFLCIPIKDTTLSTIDDFLYFFKSKVNVHQTFAVNDDNGQFKYFGFYKALFDFLIAPPPVKPDLYLNGQNAQGKYSISLSFNEGGHSTIDIILTKNEYSIYKSIAIKSFKSGGILTGSVDRQTFAPVVSKIRKKITNRISEDSPGFQYSELYLPCRRGNCYYVPIDSNKVYIATGMIGNRQYIKILHYKPQTY